MIPMRNAWSRSHGRDKAVFTLLAALVASSAGPAVPLRPSRAEIARASLKLLERAVTPNGPGAVLLVARGSEVVFRGARGRAHIELGVPIAPDHVFRIASVTKIFTAATVLKLAEGGRMSLDDSLSSFLPDFPNAETITIRQLLNHTSGISDVVKDPQPGFSRREITSGIRLGEIRKRPLDFPPGSSRAYSNAGYILLGAVIERVTGEPWHVTLQKALLEPLGLRHTRLGAESVLIAGRVAGYSRDRRSRSVINSGFISMTVPDAAGALVSNADDLLAWMRALTGGRSIGGESYLQMITPPATDPGVRMAFDYGLGVYLWHVRGAPMIGHTGQIDGFTAAVGYLPGHDITTVVLANDDTFDARVVNRRLAAIALGDPYPDVVAVQPSEAELRELEGTYQFDEKTVQTLSVKDNTLYSRRGTRDPLPLQMTARRHLHFVPDELTYFVPIRDASGSVIRLDHFQDGEGPPRPIPRIR